MPDDERLREALLELQVLRDREARSLSETRALLACFQAYSEAATPDKALETVFSSLRDTIQSVRTLVLERVTETEAMVVAADSPDLIGHAVSAPVDLFARARSLADLSVVGEWGGAVVPGTHKGLLICPVQDALAVMCLRAAPHGFRTSDLKLLQRLAGLAAQAHRNAQVAKEKDLLSAAIAGSSSGIAIADAEDGALPLVYVNAAFEALSGYSAEEVLGQNCRFLSAEPPDSPERARIRAAVAAREPGTFLLRNRRKS